MKQSFEQVQNEYLWIVSEGSLIRTMEVGQKFNFYQNMPMRNVHMQRAITIVKQESVLREE